MNPNHYAKPLLPPPTTYRFPSPADQPAYKKPLEKDERRSGQDGKTSHYYWPRDSRRAFPQPAVYTPEDMALIASAAEAKQLADGASALSTPGSFSIDNLPPTPPGYQHKWQEKPHPDVNQLPTAVSPYPLAMKA